MSLNGPPTKSFHILNKINVCSRVQRQQLHDNFLTDFGNLIHWLALSRCTALPSQEANVTPRSSLVSDFLTNKGHEKLERFSHYVVRQMGFKDRRECPHLSKLGNEYIRKPDCCEEDIYSFFSEEPDANSLFIKLVEKFKRCILSYFAYHWSHADRKTRMQIPFTSYTVDRTLLVKLDQYGKTIVVSPSRFNIQQELKYSIQKVERFKQ